MTTRNIGLILCVAALTAGLSLLVHAQDAATEPVSVTGNWTYSYERGGGGSSEVTFRLQQEGDQIKGTVSGFGDNESTIESGSVTGNQVTFTVTREFRNRVGTTTYTGTLEGDTFKGKAETTYSQDFEATREAEPPGPVQ